MVASVKEIDALNITLFNSCINFTNVHLCNYCTKIFVILSYVVTKHVIDFRKEPILLQNVGLIFTGQIILRIYGIYPQPIINHPTPPPTNHK